MISQDVLILVIIVGTLGSVLAYDYWIRNKDNQDE